MKVLVPTFANDHAGCGLCDYYSHLLISSVLLHWVNTITNGGRHYWVPNPVLRERGMFKKDLKSDIVIYLPVLEYLSIKYLSTPQLWLQDED